MLFNTTQQSSYTAFAYNAPALMRFINNLACATQQSQAEVLTQVQVENREVIGGRKKAIIHYTLPIKVSKKTPTYFKDVDSLHFIWPSERLHS
ncbi:MAG: hypothetical protein HRU20_05475 [Pseudomonadales bacterium]|nr:hypothetical protein [Pseudomonadales bacterium]